MLWEEPSPENLATQISSFQLNSITNLHSDPEQVAFLCSLSPSLLADLHDCFQPWHDILLNSLILLDAFFHLLRLPCVKNVLLKAAPFWPTNVFDSILCTGPTQDNVYRRALSQSCFVSSTALDPVNQNFLPGSHTLERQFWPSSSLHEPCWGCEPKGVQPSVTLLSSSRPSSP